MILSRHVDLYKSYHRYYIVVVYCRSCVRHTRRHEHTRFSKWISPARTRGGSLSFLNLCSPQFCIVFVYFNPLIHVLCRSPVISSYLYTTVYFFSRDYWFVRIGHSNGLCFFVWFCFIVIIGRRLTGSKETTFKRICLLL